MGDVADMEGGSLYKGVVYNGASSADGGGIPMRRTQVALDPNLATPLLSRLPTSYSFRWTWEMSSSAVECRVQQSFRVALAPRWVYSAAIAVDGGGSQSWTWKAEMTRKK